VVTMASDCVALILRSPVAVGSPGQLVSRRLPVEAAVNERVVSANSLSDKCPAGHLFGRIVASLHRNRPGRMQVECDPRRFRLGDKKEAAGACRGCGEPMDFQSRPADNSAVATFMMQSGYGDLSRHIQPQYGTMQRPRRRRLPSCRLLVTFQPSSGLSSQCSDRRVGPWLKTLS
jgi:hypothetical protein